MVSPYSISVEAKKPEPTLAGQKVFLDSSFLLFMFQFYLQTQPSNSLCSFPQFFNAVGCFEIMLHIITSNFSHSILHVVLHVYIKMKVFLPTYFSTLFRLTILQQKPVQVMYLLETNLCFWYWSVFFIVLRQTQRNMLKERRYILAVS